MKKYALLAGTAAMIFVISGCTNNKNTNKTVSHESKVYTSTNKDEKEDKELGTLYQEKNNLKKPDIEEARNFKTSLKNGSIIMVSKESKEAEVYNIEVMDKFLASFNSGKEAYVRVIKGSIKADGTFLVNKLEEYETDGKIIKDTVYDAYDDKNKFIKGKPIYCPKMVKTYSDNGIRYAILENKDTPDNMGATVISFDKNSIK
ncbi:DUF4362 domain-containing protein [Clostridium sp. YIM B02515]|uniref:DUF4362 domain-containing protein n=1 Tax=Clostridium rhizosphaerae TaxID=2803861 RepID=A0ABS1T742_9CLOT|nr:DUF4362 domain-containing protein [Clostridium rhizosphaerae]MBL4934144.1 DUF4362 domain-containing protein [Clostridium rhizosphaerae]